MKAKNLRFPEWYYGGPYARVENPDGDLPRRLQECPIDDEMRNRTEFHGTVDGQRLIPPFGDSNRLDDIVGLLDLASGYPASWDEEERYYYPTIQGCLSEIMDRIRDRMSRTRGRRYPSFSEANARVHEARLDYAAGDYVSGEKKLLAASDSLRSGNRANRRRARFIVSSTGETSEIE